MMKRLIRVVRLLRLLRLLVLLCGDCSTQRTVAQNDRGKGHYIEGFPEPVQHRFLSVERRAQPEWEQYQ